MLVTQGQASPRVVKVQAPASGTTVSGLRNGVEATFEVFSVTEAGSSAPAGPITATPLTGMEGEVAGIIVEFEAGVEVRDGQQLVPGEQLVSTVGLSVEGKVSDDAVLIELSEAISVSEAEQVATQLEADPAVKWAEPDRFLFTASDPIAQPVSLPDDTKYATDQWNLWDEYGIGIGNGETTMTDAWAKGTGAGATVAVIDTGITAHPDLDSQIVAGYDFVSDPAQLAASRVERGPPVAFDADSIDPMKYGASGWDANPSDPGDWRGVAPVRDSTWHGTKVAGVIAAQARNTEGIAGIAPNAKIQPIRALSWRGGLLSDIAAAVTWASGGIVEGVAANGNPSGVINLSLTAQATCPTALQDAINGARERGSVVVAAAGNANDDAANYTPGNCNGVLTVGATDRAGKRAPYSNHGNRIDISAPGGDIPVDGGILTTSNEGRTDAGNSIWSADLGTSFSAAHVAAAAAILKGQDATRTPDDIANALTGTIRSFASNVCDSDPSISCGRGILSLAQVAATCTPSSSDLTAGSTVYRVVTFSSAGTCEWTPPAGLASLDRVLVVGGGGGAGAWVGGGGGGGGVTQVSTNLGLTGSTLS